MIKRHYYDPPEMIVEDIDKYERRFGDRLKAACANVLGRNRA